MSGEVMSSYTRRQRLGLLVGVPLFVGLLLLPTPSGMSATAHRTVAVTVLMAFWWITEAIPIPATALIPLVAFPLLQITRVRAAAAAYADPNIFLFMGGFFMAVTMERWGLHRRIALQIIRILGTSPRRIVLGFMVATAFISMWISNTATTMMMLPIALAVLTHARELLREPDQSSFDPNFQTALMLGIAYSASIGGIGTLIGTPPNLVFVAAVKRLFPQAPEIGFFQWFLVGLPLVILFLPISWLYLTHLALPIRLKELPGGRKVIQEELQKLGPMSRAETYTLSVFLVMALGWIFRKDIQLGIFTIPGWSTLLGVSKWVHDSTVAIGVALLLFLIPVDFRRGVFLLDWKSAVRIPWGILILFGGGIALAEGFRTTGLAQWIGNQLVVLKGVPIPVMIVAVTAMLDFLTEITSNTAIATIFMPITAATALGMKMHPFLLMVPATIATSLAFMLPVATPPNAIVMGSGYVTVPQMARAGFGMDLLGIVMVFIIVYSLAIPIFGIPFAGLPPWAQ